MRADEQYGEPLQDAPACATVTSCQCLAKTRHLGAAGLVGRRGVSVTAKTLWTRKKSAPKAKRRLATRKRPRKKPQRKPRDSQRNRRNTKTAPASRGCFVLRSNALQPVDDVFSFYYHLPAVLFCVAVELHRGIEGDGPLHHFQERNIGLGVPYPDGAREC